jgi:hypothetical protein
VAGDRVETSRHVGPDEQFSLLRVIAYLITLLDGKDPAAKDPKSDKMSILNIKRFKLDRYVRIIKQCVWLASSWFSLLLKPHATTPSGLPSSRSWAMCSCSWPATLGCRRPTSMLRSGRV